MSLKQIGDLCAIGSECESSQCYPVDCAIQQCYLTLEDKYIQKCAKYVLCGSVNSVHIFVSITESQCKQDNGEYCSNESQCQSGACYKIVSNLNMKKCAKPIICDSNYLNLYENKYISACKKVNGETCSLPQDCVSNNCYLDHADKNIYKCSVVITCQNNYMQIYEYTNISSCKKDSGELCSRDSDCYSDACYQSLVDSSIKQCSVRTTCTYPNLQYFKDKFTTKCLKPEGEDCQINDDTCAYGCYNYQNLYIQCYSETPPTCTSQQVGIIKAPNYLIKCYLIADQDCVQSNDQCEFTCLIDLDANTPKCSSSNISCLPQETSVIIIKTPVCKLSTGGICSQNSDCASNQCYINFNMISQKQCALYVQCGTNQTPVYIDLNTSQCKYSIGETCSNSQDCLNLTCYQTLTDSSVFKCSVPTTCSSPLSQFFFDNTTSICKLAIGLECTDQLECGSNSCYKIFSNISQNLCATKTTCGPNETQVYIDSTNSDCKKNVGETCSSSQNLDCITKACYQTTAVTSVFKCSVPTTCITPLTQFFQDNVSSVCKLSAGLKCTENSDCISNFCYLNFNNISQKLCATQKLCGPNQTQVYIDQTNSACKNSVGEICFTAHTEDCVTKTCYQSGYDNFALKCAVPITCNSPSSQFYLDNTNSICKLAVGLDCSDNSECVLNACYPDFQSTSKKCAQGSIDCSQWPGKIPVLAPTNTPICVLDTGSTCFIEGQNNQCLSGICAQVKNQPSTLKCISISSISTCQGCDSSHKCVSDSNSIGSCLLTDGNTGCTSDAVCANSCIFSLDNQLICSVSCGECDSSKCIPEPTGKQPKCKGNDLNGGAVAGIIIASLVVFFSLMIFLLCLVKRRKQKKQAVPEETQNTQQQSETAQKVEEQIINEENIARIEIAGIQE
ncbi:Hypothetical_protein [Hexamita inflata]|uniref:Hypothetical_protein n=1 Tax=Hexamita inflata TaxID=28002 RepID=A0ABP1HPM5_9EUKA